MARRIAHAEWTGELAKGRGEVSIAGETVGLAYVPAWLQEGAGTNPEELLAAAHAASFAMALEAAFSRARHPAGAIRVRAELHLDHREGTWTIARSDLEAGIALEDDPRRGDTFAAEFERIVEDGRHELPGVSRWRAWTSLLTPDSPTPALKQIPHHPSRCQRALLPKAIAAGGVPSKAR